MAKAVLKRSETATVRKPAKNGAKLAVVPSPEQRQAAAEAQLALGRGVKGTRKPRLAGDKWVEEVATQAMPHVANAGSVSDVDWQAVTVALRPVVGPATIADVVRLHNVLRAASSLFDEETPLDRGRYYATVCLERFILSAAAETFEDATARVGYIIDALKEDSMEAELAAWALLHTAGDMRFFQCGRQRWNNTPALFSEWDYVLVPGWHF